jgi:hypothetical protein
MKKLSFLIVILLLNYSMLFSQVAINADGSAPDASAGLDVYYTNKGFLPPRMTQGQIGEIPYPANGLIVFCTTDNKFYTYILNVNTWKEILFGSGTIAPTYCGASITINHVSGTVAPVNKTVTYGTATNIPGETSKCWITSNLGADHQATAATDATEASAGWYWQFNLQQGYKHDGTTRTPNNTWITSIDENSEWVAANDPCNLELGSGWRLPTLTEWTNVDASGGWTYLNDAWNSALKMHAAGSLDGSDGSLNDRGSFGSYWSSSQYSDTYGWYLFLNDSDVPCGMYNNRAKVFGFTTRCIRD